MSDNYMKVYEMKFIDKKELSEKKLLRHVLKSFKEKKAISTESGTFYIKDFSKKSNSLVFLFGKDNENEFNTSITDEELIPKEVEDKITYWMLKIIIEMGGS